MKGSKQKAASRKELQPTNSYYGRHLQKTKTGQAEYQKLATTNNKKWSETEIAQRGEQIINALQKKRDISIIRIEDSFLNLSYSKNNHPESESLCLARITQVRKKLDSVDEKIKDQQRITKQYEKQLEERRLKYASLIEKQQTFNRKLQDQTVQDEPERIQTIQQTLQAKNKDKQSEQEINSLKEDQKILAHEVHQLEEELSFLQRQFKRLESSEETEETVEDLNELIEENQRIKENIEKLENNNEQLQRKISEIENSSKPTQELYRRFAQLFEKIFINREMQKLEAVMQAKEQLFKRQEDLQRSKIFIKERKKQIAQREKRIQEKEKLCQKITTQILDISNRMLMLQHDAS